MRLNILRRTGGAALCLLLAGGLACGCAQDLSPAGSGAASQQQQSGSAGTEAAAPNYNSSALDDGKLRILYGATQNQGNTVLLGGTVLCKAAPSDSLWLLQDSVTGETNYYQHAWNDAGSPSGRRCSIYDKTGAEVLRFDEAMDVWLSNGYLSAFPTGTQSEYDGSVSPGTLRLFELSTGAELAVPENAVNCFAINGYLVFTLYQYADTQSADESAQITGCSVQIQDQSGNVVFERENCTPTELASTALSDWVLLYVNDGSPYNSTGETLLYRPSDGTLFENYEQACGGAAVCLRTASGQYELRDLSGEAATVLGTFDELPSEYLPGKVLLYSDSAAYDYELRDLAAGESIPVQRIYYAEDELALYTADGTLLLYDTITGEELLRANAAFSTPAENGYYIEALGSGYVGLQKYGGVNSESRFLIYGPDGFTADLSALAANYSYFSSLTVTEETGPLFTACYDGPGGASLYDVVDCEGNVLLHGLASCYAAYSAYGALPTGCFYARRGYDYGWMDTNGNWLYCESLFDTLAAEDGTSYIYG